MLRMLCHELPNENIIQVDGCQSSAFHLYCMNSGITKEVLIELIDLWTPELPFFDLDQVSLRTH